MSEVGTAANRQPSNPTPGALPSAHGQLPKTAAFWLMAVIFAALLFSASAPTRPHPSRRASPWPF